MARKSLDGRDRLLMGVLLSVDGVVFAAIGFILYRLWRGFVDLYTIAGGPGPNVFEAIIGILVTVSLVKLGFGAALIWDYRRRVLSEPGGE